MQEEFTFRAIIFRTGISSKTKYRYQITFYECWFKVGPLSTLNQNWATSFVLVYEFW